jgi:hypothetical protein
MKPMQAFGGLLLGAIVVLLIAALLGSYTSSSNADTRTEALASKLEKVTHDLTALRDANATQQTSTVKARATLQHNNDVLQYQNRVLQQKILTLIRLLRAQGVTVPPTIAPSSTPSAVPKAPRRLPHHSPGSPAPTVPSPTANPVCQLVPALCTGFPLGLPPLLP